MNPEMFGAVGDGTTDDTVALRAMVAAVNSGATDRIVFTPGKTYILSHEDQGTLYFHDLDGLLIEGYGAILKTANSGAPTVSLGTNWGQINIGHCRNVAILGLTLDGNRGGQEHTAPLNDGQGFNAGINIHAAGTTVPASSYIRIAGCRFVNHGVLSGEADARGDGIYAVSGVSHLYIEDNSFEQCGRFAIAVAEGAEGSSHIYIRGNRILMGNRNSPAPALSYVPWGAIDIEDADLDNEHIYITGNLFTGTSQIAIGGNAASSATASGKDIYIRDNVWRLPSASGGTDTPFNFGEGVPGTGTYRTFERLFIENNVVSWAGVPMTVNLGGGAKLVDVFVRHNIFRAENPTADSDRGLQIAYGGHIEGRIEISDNLFIALGEAIKNNNWYADPDPAALQMRIERNRFDSCYRSWNISMTGSAVPTAGSRIVFRDNLSENSRGVLVGGSGETIIGAGIPTEIWGVERHDAITNHIGVAYKVGKGIAYVAADYTLDLGIVKASLLQVDKATAATVTVPPDSALALANGTILEIEQKGAGAVTVAAGAGVTLNGTLSTAAQYQLLRLRKTAANRWLVTRTS
jgi:hypothetical protein